ncbi:hypothetical protein FOCC_FOCC017493, partial [Frankliniella occidentalis]
MLVMLLLLLVSGVVSGPGPKATDASASALTSAPGPGSPPRSPAEAPVNDAPAAPPSPSSVPPSRTQQQQGVNMDAVDDEDDDVAPDGSAALASQPEPDLLGLSGTLGTKERLELVKKLLKQEPLIDGHNDLPWNIRKFVHNRLARLQLEDLRQGPGPWSRSNFGRRTCRASRSISTPCSSLWSKWMSSRGLSPSIRRISERPRQPT